MAAMAPRSAVASRSARELRLATVLALKLAACSALALPGLVCTFAPKLYNRHRQYYDVDTSVAERVVVLPLESFWAFNSGKVGLDIAWSMFLPVVFATLLRSSARQAAVFVASVLPGLAGFKALQRHFGSGSVYGMGALCLPILAFMICLKVALRQNAVNAKLPRSILQYLVTVIVGVVLSRIRNLVHLDTASQRLIFVAIIIPALREAMFLVSQASGLFVWRHNFGFPVRRWACIFLFWWLQVFWAMYMRTFMADVFGSQGQELVHVVIIQACTELAVRLTLLQRMKLLAGLRVYWHRRRDALLGSSMTSSVTPALSAMPTTRRGGGRRLSRALVNQLSEMHLPRIQLRVPEEEEEAEDGTACTAQEGASAAVAQAPVSGRATPTIGNMQKPTATADQPTYRSFYVMWLVSNMLAEYVAIVVVPVMILLCEHRKLQIPFEFYNTMADPFREQVDRLALGQAVLYQLGAELLVDVVCIAFEMHRGLDIATYWSRLPWLFFAALVVAGWHALAVVDGFLTAGASFRACTGRDMCECSGRGLPPHGLLQRYCDFIELFEANNGTVGAY